MVLAQPLNPGSSLNVKIEEVFAHAMSPFPTKITQSEKQFVLFSGNHYLYSFYTVKSQTTTVTLASSTIESYSKLKPSSQQDSMVKYGPYTDIEPFKQSPMRIHFENNSPFLSVSWPFISTASALRLTISPSSKLSLIAVVHSFFIERVMISFD